MTGSRTGKSPMRVSLVVAMRPSMRLTSVDVPPMSNEITRDTLAAAATACAPTTPAAGPESTVRTAPARAVAAEIDPPFDCMIDSRVFPSDASSRPRYLSISGVT